MRFRFFYHKYSNILFSTPVSEGQRLKNVLKDEGHLETVPFVEYGAGTTCSVVVDVKREYEESVIARGLSVEKITEGGKIEKTTLSNVSKYEGYLPTRKKKALEGSIIFVLATYGSVVGADSGIVCGANAITTLTLPSFQAFLPVLPKALFIAIFPTIVATCLRKLGQDK